MGRLLAPTPDVTSPAKKRSIVQRRPEIRREHLLIRVNGAGWPRRWLAFEGGYDKLPKFAFHAFLPQKDIKHGRESLD